VTLPLILCRLRGRQYINQQNIEARMRKLILAMLLIAVPFISNAQTSRAGSWEGSISAIFQDSIELDGENGSYLDVDSELGFGFNFALNINPKLSVGLDIEYLKPRYSMLLVDDTNVNDDLIIV
jgi:hypothetical protein